MSFPGITQLAKCDTSHQDSHARTARMPFTKKDRAWTSTRHSIRLI